MRKLLNFKFLCSADSAIIPAFKRAATKVPAYKRILQEYNIDYRKIKNAEDFKKFVPVISKNEVFPRFEIEELCVGGSIEKMKSAMTSSGFSGVFSFGINTKQNIKNTAQSIDLALDYVFHTSKKKTLLINALPMGVKVHTNLKLVETSVRSDMVLAIIKKLSSKFEQTLIISDPHFLKKLVEEGNEEKLEWEKLGISLISGGDWFSESFRSYLAQIVDIDFDNPSSRLIGSTMGVAELDLNLFHESLNTILIRRKIQTDANLRKFMFGKDVKIAPIIFHYYPHKIFLEALSEDSEEKELVFSILSPDNIMLLVRYNSKDRGWIFSHNQIKEILTKYNYQNLIPDLKLPFVAVAGRKDRFLEVNGKRIYPEEIKQGLYEDFDVAAKTTGYFKLNKEPKLEIQLKKGIIITNELNSKFRQAALKYSDIDLPVVLYHYQDFPYGMELDYERKFNNL